MATTKYLEENGVAYLWEKLKKYVDDNRTVDTIAHTTQYWLNNANYVPPYGVIVIYTDYQTVGNIDGTTSVLPAFKVGDGDTRVNDLPFSSAEQVSKLAHSLTIGDYIYDGSRDVTVPVYKGETY